MDEVGLKKRYQGRHYEAGLLPNWLESSRTYWCLPYEFRRAIFRFLAPRSFYGIRYLRERKSKNVKDPTLKPFLDTKSIFVHIPKCAGTTLTTVLYGNKTGDHRKIKDYSLCFRESEFESFFKFAFVRNPWDRLVSAYFYMKQGGRNKEDNSWAKRYLSCYNSFDEFVVKWVNEENVRLGLHFIPQFEFLCIRDLVLKVDFIGYFEDIHNDYAYICNRIGCSRELLNMNISPRERKNYQDYYNKETEAIVRSVYREDIKLFGYTFEGIGEKLVINKNNASIFVGKKEC